VDVNVNSHTVMTGFFMLCFGGSIIRYMSGHSKWSTIKRQKGLNDQARGKLFSKFARAISIAAKSGPDPDANYKLRVVIDSARAANMPKVNIERAISKASESGELVEVVYEGFGPHGISVIAETVTDNRNRTAQEMKSIFERGGGSLAGPGSVSYNFKPKGLIVIGGKDAESQILDLIDMGVEDVEEGDGVLEVYVAPSELSSFKQKLENEGYEIMSTDLVMKPVSFKKIDDVSKASQAVGFLEKLEEHEDVQKVFANLDTAAD
jgi:YebC/PmpR family DNA-binding regulatory protein